MIRLVVAFIILVAVFYAGALSEANWYREDPL